MSVLDGPHRERHWSGPILVLAVGCLVLFLICGVAWSFRPSPQPDNVKALTREVRGYHEDAELYLDRLDGKKQNKIDKALQSVTATESIEPSEGVIP